MTRTFCILCTVMLLKVYQWIFILMSCSRYPYAYIIVHFDITGICFNKLNCVPVCVGGGGGICVHTYVYASGWHVFDHILLGRAEASPTLAVRPDFRLWSTIYICITRILAQKRKASFPSIRLPPCRRRPRRRSSTGLGHNLERFSNAVGRFHGRGAPSLLPDSTVFDWLPFLSRTRQVFGRSFILPSSLD